MSTVKDIYLHSIELLKQANVENYEYFLKVIFSKILNCKILDIFLFFDQSLSSAQIEKILSYVKRRSFKEPLEYILGETFFYNCKLKITPDVLIPRPETEELVDLVVKFINKENLLKNKINVFDICTGSGCIAIALKKHFQSLNVFASDISSDALKIAKSNAILNNCKINFKRGDLLEPFEGEKADIIICNPPYISEDEYGSLADDVKNYEPRRALVADDDGLYFYKEMEKNIFNFLKPKAKVFFEIGYDQKEVLNSVFLDKRWQLKKVYKDLSGKDRFFFLEIE